MTRRKKARLRWSPCSLVSLFPLALTPTDRLIDWSSSFCSLCVLFLLVYRVSLSSPVIPPWVPDTHVLKKPALFFFWMVSGSSASPVATGTGVPETKAARATPPLQRVPGASGVAGSLGRLGPWVAGLSGFSHNASPTTPSPAFRNGSRERPQGSLQSRYGIPAGSVPLNLAVIL